MSKFTWRALAFESMSSDVEEEEGESTFHGLGHLV
jgi:hypothetical protein